MCYFFFRVLLSGLFSGKLDFKIPRPDSVFVWEKLFLPLSVNLGLRGMYSTCMYGTYRVQTCTVCTVCAVCMVLTGYRHVQYVWYLQGTDMYSVLIVKNMIILCTTCV